MTGTVTATCTPRQSVFSSPGRTGPSQPFPGGGTAFLLSFHRPLIADVLVPAVPGGLEDKRPPSRRKIRTAPLPAGTGGRRAPGAGRWGRPQAPSRPSLSLLPELASLLPTWAEKGEKKEERQGRAAREQVRGANGIPSVTCQLKPHGPLLGTPWGCNRPSRVALGCKPHLGTQTAPARRQTWPTHGIAGRWPRSPPAHPAVPPSFLKQKGDGSDPQGEGRGKL